MVAGNDQRRYSCRAQYVEFRNDILMRKHLPVLGNIAGNQHQVGTDVFSDSVNHRVEKMLAVGAMTCVSVSTAIRVCAWAQRDAAKNSEIKKFLIVINKIINS